MILKIRIYTMRHAFLERNACSSAWAVIPILAPAAKSIRFCTVRWQNRML